MAVPASQRSTLTKQAMSRNEISFSYFEQRAMAAEPKFGLSIRLLRSAADEMLGSIKASGFFRTYTDHSIKHCEQMLAILSWLLPELVKIGLTDIECTLLVASVYLHDLGMLASQEEFANRQNSGDFVRFHDRYLQTFDSSANLHTDHPTLDHFIFEEYIRHTHAQRIFDWLSDKHPNSPQAQQLNGLLQTATGAFRHQLAVICKSHHLNDLENRQNYALDFQFGNDPDDRANIQFIAICLRLADILHMSSDRTPPFEFRVISPRNPVSAREWAKQLKVSGIGLAASDPTEIRVHAVCDNPRIYFYLKDFIRICDEELSRCRAWLENIPAPLTNQYHLAVRHVSQAGLQAHGFIAERFELQLDQRRIIDLLMGHSLYGDAKVAIRELIQNSLDAVRVRQLEDQSLKPSIEVFFDTKQRQLEVTDNGIGMDLNVIRDHFLKVGDSYYRSASFRRRCPRYTPISQFGIGFLSSFMIADRVTVITRASTGSSPAVIVDLEDIYDLFAVRQVLASDPEAQRVVAGGTSVILHLRKEIELTDLIEDVKKWLVFLEFPIRVRIDEAPVVDVWGIKGNTPDEIASDIISRSSDFHTEFFPILINRDEVEIVILWPGRKLGNTPILDPAGKYLLPLEERIKYWYIEDIHFREGRSTNLVRKVANSGIFLTNEVPGLKIKDQLQIHYIVDCRGALRFTPLVSRAGIAIDDSCIKIVDLFIGGLIQFFGNNIQELLKSGVSKYFCSYYAASALGLLFSREEIGKKAGSEMIFSALMALRHAASIPYLLFKKGNEIVLKSWVEHGEEPVVIGRNVYDGLLRSAAFGLMDFPLPKEVIESLPENYIFTMGAEDVIQPIMFKLAYQPVAVQYHESSRGVFIVCERNIDQARFGNISLVDFPDSLRDVAALKVSVQSCLNNKNTLIQRLKEFADRIASSSRDVDQGSVEEACVEIVYSLNHRGKGRGGMSENEFRRSLRRQLSDLDASGIGIPEDLIDLCLESRVIHDDLWTLH